MLDPISRFAYGLHLLGASLMTVIGAFGVLPVELEIDFGQLVIEFWPGSYLTIVGQVLVIVGSARRAAAVGYSRWLGLLYLVPFIGFMFVFWLLFIAKHRGDPSQGGPTGYA